MIHPPPSVHTVVSTMEDSDAVRRQGVLRRLYIASALCAAFLIVEIAGGLIANSLAILSDAAHLFADLASFAVASKFLVLDGGQSTHVQ
jgi:zinc transporter 2